MRFCSARPSGPALRSAHFFFLARRACAALKECCEMTRTLTGCFVAALLAATASAAGPEAKYTAPRTSDGRPDLQGVWNFASGVPLQRPAKFADRKVLTKEEFDAERAAFLNVLRTIAKVSPINDVGLDWIDNSLYVNDRRTSLITYPENGRLPALVNGVQRMPGIEDIFAVLQDVAKGPPLALANLLAAFGAGKKDSHKDFSTAERCLEDITSRLCPGSATTTCRSSKAAISSRSSGILAGGSSRSRSGRPR